jgi:transposase-like protein
VKKDEIKKLTAAISRLTASELNRVKKAVAKRERGVEADIVETEMAESVKVCPHCGHKELRSAGSKGGRKRFRCINPALTPDGTKVCGRTFNGFTGTPLSGLHKPELFIENARHMVAGDTVRKTADALGLNKDTAFHWRHRFLKSLDKMQPARLSGLVEADETYFLESFKGQRMLPQGRMRKKRGTPAEKRGLSKEQIPVLVARDRATGSTLSVKIEAANAKNIGGVLVPVLAKDAELFSDGASPYRVIARESGITLRVVPKSKKHKTKGALHINNVNAYDRRLKRWLMRFNGVATKYLHNYLGWHRWLDARKGDCKALRFLTDAAKRRQ